MRTSKVGSYRISYGLSVATIHVENVKSAGRSCQARSDGPLLICQRDLEDFLSSFALVLAIEIVFTITSLFSR